MSDEVLVERRGAVQVITINRPEARNALNGAVAAGIRDAADELDADGALRVGVLTGAGGTFSSGMDLKAFLKGETPSFPGRGLCGITQTPPRKPLIGAAEGWALAGGFELLLACDLVVAGASARFGVPEVKRGLVAGAGGALLLARRIPRALALEMILTGDPFDARRAAEIGLVNRVVDEGQALEEALGMAEKIAANGPLALIASKEISNGGSGLDRRGALGRDGQGHAAGVHVPGRAGRRAGVRREARPGVERPVKAQPARFRHRPHRPPATGRPVRLTNAFRPAGCPEFVVAGVVAWGLAPMRRDRWHGIVGVRRLASRGERHGQEGREGGTTAGANVARGHRPP
jgi:enoyl-CoA hydratase